VPPLTEQAIKSTVPKPKNYKLFDGYGLYLLVTPTGGKHFKLAYRYDGKQNILAIGTWPITTLSKARNLAFQAKEHLSEGVVDPSVRKKAAKQAKSEAIDTASRSMNLSGVNRSSLHGKRRREISNIGATA